MADRKAGATESRGRTVAARVDAPAAHEQADAPRVRHDVSLLTEDDLYLFNEGTHYRLFDKLGSHVLLVDEQPGTYFAVWAPDAERVAVMGDFNGWSPEEHLLAPRGSSGIWEGFIPAVGRGTRYKYHIWSRFNGFRVDKADPFALYAEESPLTASVVWDTWHEWNDADWMAERGRRNALDAPFATYELHLGSWMRGEDNRVLTYRELAPRLVEYLTRLGFTHVEFLPVMEHPFGGSWGYQVTGYFAPTSRFGTPQDFMYLVQELHRAGIGVILDWVPSHFPGDVHGLVYFDGTHLFEHADPRQGFHPDWASYIFNYSRNEVRSFLGSSAVFWLDRYHADGLRVDAVASMLYLDYSRQGGEWIPNEFGGRENLGAINFLRNVNAEIYREFPDAQTVAEESTAWPMVSRPTYVGGLGFGMKWDMGWMHDTLSYMSNDPVHRRWHHGELTFRMIYAFNENFVLPLSHDEVVHGKGSLLGKMPGDEWQKFANLRLLFGYMWAQPGKKLLFMGGEFGQGREWNHEQSLDWHQLEYPNHQGLQRFMQQLNAFYRSEPALWQLDFSPQGFEWVDANDNENSVLTFLRKGREPADVLLCCFNFTPVPRTGYRVGVPLAGVWQEVLNSDAPEYYGGGMGNMGVVQSRPEPCHGRPHCLELTLPPLAALFLRAPREADA
ncbi:MAG TPA: 1,4-alpha-glucan branching protein GlgB [Longimicrobiales bacterium]